MKIFSMKVLFLMCLFVWVVGKAEEKAFNVEVILNSTVTMNGNPITVPDSENIKIESHIVEIAPKSEIGKHSHPYPVLTYVLSGHVEVENEDGTKKTFSSGESFIEDENTWVINRNNGSEPAKFLAVLYANKDQETVQIKN